MYIYIITFHLKESVAGCHRLLIEAYCNQTPTIQTVENWFRRFKSEDFDLEDKERPRQPKKFGDTELEAFLDQDACVTLEMMAHELKVDVSTVSKRLKAMGVIQRQGHWVPYQLKPRGIEKRLVMW